MPRTIGVLESPADLNAPLSMKKISIPKLNTNIIRRKGSASLMTAGSRVDEIEKRGRREIADRRHMHERDKDRRKEPLVNRAVTFSWSLAPANRATRTLMPIKMDDDEDDDDEEYLEAYPDRGVCLDNRSDWPTIM